MPPVITGRKFLVRFQTFLSHKPDILLQDRRNGYRNPLCGGARHNHRASAPTMSVSPELSNFMIPLLGSIVVSQSGVLGLSQNIAYQTCTPLLAASRKDGPLICKSFVIFWIVIGSDWVYPAYILRTTLASAGLIPQLPPFAPFGGT